MGRSKLTWDEVCKYEAIDGYGGHIYYHDDNYYYVDEEGGVLAYLVVYDLTKELFDLLASGKKTLSEIGFMAQNDRWPPTAEEKRETEKNSIEKIPTVLIDIPKYRDLFTQVELERLIPIAEQQWIDWKGKLPDTYVSPLKKNRL